MNVTSHELGITRAVGSQLITNCQEAYFQALAMGVSSDKVFRASNGVDTTVFTPQNDGLKLRNLIGVSADTPLIGFAGRLEHEKGPDLFLRVAQSINYQRPDVHFVIIGEGTMADELSDICAQFRLEKNVHFIGWQTNTAEVYPALNLLAHTSRSDGTSLVLLEAMACGCPAVALAVGGLREIVENQCTGVIVGAGDWEGMSHHILHLLKHPAKMQKMGKAARVRVEKYFDVRKNTQLTGNILKRFAYKPIKGNKYIDKSVLQSEINSLDS
jgi:glycosyltransferase involved in cell wall biosynthesis